MEATSKRETITAKEMEMLRMCGAIPEEKIDILKSDMSAFIASSWDAIKRLENTYPEGFDHHGFKERHNHIELEGDMTHASKDGFYGATLIVSDIHELEEEEEKQIPLSEIMPPILLNDLVVKTSRRMDDGRKKSYYEVHKYDPKTGLYCYSQFEFQFAQMKAEKKPIPIGAVMPDRAIEHTQLIPAHLELIQSAIFPLRWVTTMLITGMWGRWQDESFYDYPVLFTWYDNVPYKLYRDFAKESLTNGEKHEILEDILEASIGYQRYLIKLTEDRDSVKIKRDKKREAKEMEQQDIEKTPDGKRKVAKHIISLNDDIKIYTSGSDTARRFKHPQKCSYRYSVRGHYRHYKNGKVVWITTYDKNKDKPFNSHNYSD